jgi:heat shock protein HtpX
MSADLQAGSAGAARLDEAADRELQVAHTSHAEAMRRNKRRTWWLVLLAMILFGCAGYLFGWALELLIAPPPETRPLTAVPLFGWQAVDWSALDWQAFAWSWWGAYGVAIGASAALALVLYALEHGGEMVMRAMGAEPVWPEDDPELVNVVEEMAIAANVPVPRIYLVETEALNAFAAGAPDEAEAAVAVTRGLRTRLTRAELQGVVAHEIGHIVNGDVVFSTMLAVLVGVVALPARIVMEAFRRPGAAVRIAAGGGGRRRGRGGGLVVLLALVALFVAAVLIPVAIRIIQAAASREREYLADATAARLTRNPQGLASALQRLERADTRIARADQAYEHLFVVRPRSVLSLGGLLCSHPPIADRIARLLDPRLD